MRYTLMLVVVASWTFALTSTLSSDANKRPRASSVDQTLRYVSADNDLLATLDKYPKHEVLNPVLKSFRELNEFFHPDGQHRLQDHNVDCHINEICHRSLCPWRIRVNENPDRVPIAITYAECITSDCHFAFFNIPSRLRRRLQFDTSCSTVQHYFTVFLNGTEAVERYPIACACSNRRHRGKHASSHRRPYKTDANFQIPDTVHQSQQRPFFNRLRDTRQYEIARLNVNSAKIPSNDVKGDVQAVKTWRQYMKRRINETTFDQP